MNTEEQINTGTVSTESSDTQIFTQESDSENLMPIDVGLILDDLSDTERQNVQRRIDWLIRIRDARNSGSKKLFCEQIRDAASALGCSTRTVQRMLDKTDKDGLIALTRLSRADKGKVRLISQPWRKLVIEWYKRTNRDGRRTNRNQIWLIISGVVVALEKVVHQPADDIEAQFAWIATKLGSAEESHSSNLNKILKEIKAEVLAGKFQPPKSHVAVYTILDEHFHSKAKKARHPGQGPTKIIKTTDGDIKIDYSNKVLQIDHTKLDVFVVNEAGEEIGRPFLSVAVDSYSSCVAGFYLGFRQPGSHEVALVLRHAILPKEYGSEFKLKKAWDTCGVPDYLVTDRAREFKSEHLRQIAAQLDFIPRLRAYPEQGGIVESIFDKLNKEVLSKLPGYTGSNVQKRPKNAEKYACIILQELEKILVRHFVDHLNQHPHPKVAQTRAQRWEAMHEPPRIPDERTLDICLLKQKQTPKVQKLGTISVFGEVYQGDCLWGRTMQKVIVRYNPADIIYLLVYSIDNDGNPGQFLGTVKARDLPQEKLSYKELQEQKRRDRQARKAIDMSSIYAEALDLNEFAEKKVKETRKQKREKEHKRTGRSEGLENVIEFKRIEASAEKATVEKGAGGSEVGQSDERVNISKQRKRFKPTASVEIASGQYDW